jgi:hypothetical protein
MTVFVISRIVLYSALLVDGVRLTVDGAFSFERSASRVPRFAFSLKLYFCTLLNLIIRGID